MPLHITILPTLATLLIPLTFALPPRPLFSLPSLDVAITQQRLPLNASIPTAGIVQCGTSADWRDTRPDHTVFDRSDCVGSLRELMADTADFGAEKFEWLSWGTPFVVPGAGEERVREGRGTPKRYVTSEWGFLLRSVLAGVGGLWVYGWRS
ncbi:MAG: hypothetical protein LQ343_004834 [Gyalolechia ehrenbergii]|nr:MAG: hypothetical protein LQ343_004834 [Gyalolechia ehrenbergii]